MTKPTVFGFSERDAKVLADIADKESRKSISHGAVDTPPLKQPVVRQYLAKTGADPITARTDDTPGSGTVTIYYLNKTTGKIEPWQNDSGADVTREVYSYATSPSGANSYVWISSDVFGTLWYANEACNGV